MKIMDKITQTVEKNLVKTAHEATPYTTIWWFGEADMPQHLKEKAMTTAPPNLKKRR